MTFQPWLPVVWSRWLLCNVLEFKIVARTTKGYHDNDIHGWKRLFCGYLIRYKLYFSTVSVKIMMDYILDVIVISIINNNHLKPRLIPQHSHQSLLLFCDFGVVTSSRYSWWCNFLMNATCWLQTPNPHVSRLMINCLSGVFRCNGTRCYCKHIIIFLSIKDACWLLSKPTSLTSLRSNIFFNFWYASSR